MLNTNKKIYHLKKHKKIRFFTNIRTKLPNIIPKMAIKPVKHASPKYTALSNLIY